MLPASLAHAVVVAAAAQPWLTPTRALVGAVLIVLAIVGLSVLHARHTSPVRPPPRPKSIDADVLTIDAVGILEGILEAETDDERRLSTLHRLHAPTLALPFSDYVRFLRAFDYVTLDAPSQSLALTRKGAEAAGLDDVPERMLAEVEHHFADVLARGVAVQHGADEERRRLALELER
jgi:hypothetical protein